MSSDKVKEKINVGGTETMSALVGAFDENISALESETGAQIFVEGENLVLTGEAEEVRIAKEAADKLIELINAGEAVDRSRATYFATLARDGIDGMSAESLSRGVVAVTSTGKAVKAKTVGQVRYIEAVRTSHVVFGEGPAGTGKTYLAVASAVAAYKRKEVERIILTRPAVEAGERLGFLPGDLQSKVDPYLRPLYDALREMFGHDVFSKLVERGTIEIAPLAYMRGRTLSDAFIILDEAQNTTVEQMKMFLTRLGEGSRMVVTGDVTQIDLGGGRRSGLKHAMRILDGVEGISIVRLTARDVVRHPLVTRIINAYQADENRKIRQ